MAMQKKIITAGPLVMETIYPRVKSNDSSRARQAKKKASSEAQARMNHIYSWQKLKLLLAANLVRGDLVFTLTFSDDRLPATREQVRRIVAGFRDKLSAARQTRGKRLVMFWSIEHLHGEGRWHIHCAANAKHQHTNPNSNHKDILIAHLHASSQKQPQQASNDNRANIDKCSQTNHAFPLLFCIFLKKHPPIGECFFLK